MPYKSKYLLMTEIAWPRKMMEEISADFVPVLLERPSEVRKFKYLKQRANEMYTRYSKYHDNEISKKSWTMLFVRGFKMRTARQNGITFLYSGPDSVRLINNLLASIPQGGGFYFDGRKDLSVVESLYIPIVKTPIIKIQKETDDKKVKINGIDKVDVTIIDESKTYEPGKIIH